MHSRQRERYIKHAILVPEEEHRDAWLGHGAKRELSEVSREVAGQVHGGCDEPT